MTTTQIVILVSTVALFVAIGVYAAWRAFRLPWPSGRRVSIATSMGNEIVVIDDTSDDELVKACASANVAILTAWRTCLPNAVSGAQVFPTIGVHFIDDSMMDDVQVALFRGNRVAAYLSEVASSFRKIPLAVIRKSLAREVVETGQPLMHEILHALMSHHFGRNAQGLQDHTHPMWQSVLSVAVATYRDLFAPKKSASERREASAE